MLAFAFGVIRWSVHGLLLGAVVRWFQGFKFVGNFASNVIVFMAAAGPLAALKFNQ